jgi:hypothetical protein
MWGVVFFEALENSYPAVCYGNPGKISGGSVLGRDEAKSIGVLLAVGNNFCTGILGRLLGIIIQVASRCHAFGHFGSDLSCITLLSTDHFDRHETTGFIPSYTKLG